MTAPKKLLSRLRTAKAAAETPPPGWRTTAQWAALWGLSLAQANNYLRRGVAEKLMQRRLYRTKTPGGRTLPTPHYAEAR